MNNLDEGLALAHFGVKGMKWGVKKNPNLTLHPDFTVKQQRQTYNAFGRGGLRRVNASMHDGMTHREAHKNELKRVYTRRAKIVGAAAVAHVLLLGGEVAMQKIAVKAETNRNTANRAETHGIASTKANAKAEADVNRSAKPDKQGVYKVHSF